MTNKTLQDLIEIHNMLYSFPVAGPTVVPMAQVLTTLQNIIGAETDAAQRALAENVEVQA